MAKKSKKTLKKLKEKEQPKLHAAIFKQLLTLSTSGFGLAAALAWNDTIKTFIDEFVKPYLSNGSGLFSQFIYAILVTIFAVAITYNLTRISKRLDKKAGINLKGSKSLSDDN
jgi:hypothetical protein